MMNGRTLYGNEDHSLSNALEQLPDCVVWGVFEEIEKRPLIIEDLELRKQCEQLDKEINDLLKDASVAQMSTEDDK